MQLIAYCVLLHVPVQASAAAHWVLHLVDEPPSSSQSGYRVNTCLGYLSDMCHTLHFAICMLLACGMYSSSKAVT